MRSLFILSLPRSLSTAVYEACLAALDLRSPSWTSAGEILNFDRCTLLHGGAAISTKYALPGNPRAFEPASDFLAQVVAGEGFAYKDVVQPFVVARWLRDGAAPAVLKIAPNIAHSAHAMMDRGWLYPSTAAMDGRDLRARMISGLRRAASAIAEVPGETIAYEDLIFGFDGLRQALERLYPERAIPKLAPGLGFDEERARALGRRTSPEFQELARLAAA